MLDLFSAKVPAAQEHPNFRIIRDSYSAGARNILFQWSEGFVDRDGKFVAELQSTFNSSFWELYLHAALREMGYSVDFGFASPDFIVLGGGVKRFAVEATIANNAQGAPPEWNRPTFGEAWNEIDGEKIVNNATVRFASAVSTKYAKYQTDYALLPHVADVPFVLAVASFDQPFFFYEGLGPALRVCYGYDIISDIRTQGAESSLSCVYKENRSPVNLGIFLTKEYRNLPALIFSNVATPSKLRALAPAGPGEKIKFFVLRNSS